MFDRLMDPDEADNDTAYDQNLVWADPSAAAFLSNEENLQSLNKVKLVGFQLERLALKDISFIDSKAESCRIVNSRLAKCSFDRSDLGFNVQGASFDRCSFMDVRLRFRGAENVVFNSCNFSKARLTCSFKGSKFTDCKFEGSSWDACKMQDSTFENSDLRSVRIEACNFESCLFRKCDFTSALFRSIVSPGGLLVRFESCNFENADLRAIKKLELDDCYIAGARLPKDISDPWSILRRRYTGIRAIANLMLLVAFFLPYVIETILWISLNRIESLPQVKESVCAQGCSEMPVAALLFGYHNGWISVLTAALLVAYNIMRGYLTLQVAPLRENEERCHYTPAREEYGPLYSVHLFVSAVMKFAVASFIVHLIAWLSSMVSAPKWFLD